MIIKWAILSFPILMVLLCTHTNINQPMKENLHDIMGYFPTVTGTLTYEFGNNIHYSCTIDSKYTACFSTLPCTTIAGVLSYQFTCIIQDQNNFDTAVVPIYFFDSDNNVYSFLDSTHSGMMIIKNDASLGEKWNEATGGLKTNILYMGDTAKLDRIFDTIVCGRPTVAFEIIETGPISSNTGADPLSMENHYIFAKGVGLVSLISYIINDASLIGCPMSIQTLTAVAGLFPLF